MPLLFDKRSSGATFADTQVKMWPPDNFFQPITQRVRSRVSAEALRAHQAPPKTLQPLVTNWTEPSAEELVVKAVRPQDSSAGSPRFAASTPAERNLPVTSNQPDGPLGGAMKRIADIVVAGIALVLVLPLMLMVALLIKVTSPGPIVYAHPRIGFQGKTFWCLKFRSMVIDGDAILAQHLKDNSEANIEWQKTHKLSDDPRVTRIGYLLRKSSIDELPQLLNVLLGDMSCIGPRPVVAAEIAKYGRYARDYLRARPGVTGMWQVSGRSSTSYERRVLLDHFYVQRWSIWLDAAILLKTVPCLLKFRDSA